MKYSTYISSLRSRSAPNLQSYISEAYVSTNGGQERHYCGSNCDCQPSSLASGCELKCGSFALIRQIVRQWIVEMKLKFLSAKKCSHAHERRFSVCAAHTCRQCTLPYRPALPLVVVYHPPPLPLASFKFTPRSTLSAWLACFVSSPLSPPTGNTLIYSDTTAGGLPVFVLYFCRLSFILRQ